MISVPVLDTAAPHPTPDQASKVDVSALEAALQRLAGGGIRR